MSDSNIKCPVCGSTDAPTPIKWTIWGGVLGPRMLHHVRCPKCANAYNGRTGRPNTTGILLFVLVPLLIGLIALYFALKS